MKLSTQTARFAFEYGDEEAIKILADIGYDAFDYSAHIYKEDDAIIYHKE